MSAVGITVAAGIEDYLLALFFIVLPKLLPERSATHGRAKVLGPMTWSHRWHAVGSKCILKLPGLGPVVAGQQSQHPESGAAPIGNHLVARPELLLPTLQVLEFLWPEAVGSHQLKCQSPTRIGNGLHQTEHRDDINGCCNPSFFMLPPNIDREIKGWCPGRRKEF